ncbi:TIGR01777 family oxidoreductase [Spirulina sp. 06S082]|uniref:thylakoid membrane protein ThyD n=1 Tax=Spirulina sp. 06S082 TaxID=3110248 RepID=UPI002B2019C8|nr:TIGR01777 family oxidoreductase [Spirulina sp. 06S082]MEA5469286.1 TIGR01777 family oxidoreductase [Spirulina sp. 06S082]
MKIAITGGTGFVGSRLVAKLNEKKENILIFTRNKERTQKMFPNSAFPTLEIVPYTPKKSGDWQEKIAGCDAVVNLAGEPLAEGRWTSDRKQEIILSRQIGTQKIVEAIAKADPKPQVLINASAIGYYGTSETQIFAENSPSGDDFLAEVCQKWEAEAEKVKENNVRLVILRLGIVLGNGGAIAKMITPFKLFMGGSIGSGKQWFSWIHQEDIVNLILEAITHPEIAGVYNATSPNPVRMEKFCYTLGEVLHRPSWLPVPSFAIEAILGDGAIVVLEGQNVQPKAVEALGFNYQYPTVKSALQEIL